MRKPFHIALAITAAVASLMACSDSDEATAPGGQRIAARLAFAVSDKASTATRQGDDVVQATGFRGIGEVKAIPFIIGGTAVGSTDRPQVFMVDGLDERFDKSGASLFYTHNCSFLAGVNAFLVYGLATPKTAGGLTDTGRKAVNGSLDAYFPADPYPSGITFSPTVICPTTEANAQANALCGYLNQIATTAGWSATTNAELKALFRNFTHQDDYGTATVMAGSSANVAAHVQALRDALTALTLTDGSAEAALRDAIVGNIDAGASTPAANPFPASIGLPDGAAVVRWSGGAFAPQTTTTTLASITAVNRYAFPADLRYYANSRIRTSNDSAKHSLYLPATATWATVLANYEYDNGAVSGNTEAVAIKAPLQYGVARLQTKLQKLATSKLPDADGKSIAVGAKTFPLTGIIVGGQRPVGFDFRPISTSDIDTRFVYDSQLASDGGAPLLYLGTAASTASVSTLLLQSADEEPVTIIAEFQNNGDTKFQGLNGVVYPGTKFYLVGQVPFTAKAQYDNDYERRVFTQDFLTQVNIEVQSLAKAYNVLPDVLSPQLELGVVLTPEWVAATPVNIVM